MQMLILFSIFLPPIANPLISLTFSRFFWLKETSTRVRQFFFFFFELDWLLVRRNRIVHNLARWLDALIVLQKKIG